MSKGQQRFSVRPKVMKYLEGRPGVRVYRAEIEEATGLKGVQITNCMSQLRREVEQGDLDFPIEVVLSGQCWIFRPNTGKKVSKTESDKRVFEELGVSKAGLLIIQDEQGKLYQAQEL